MKPQIPWRFVGLQTCGLLWSQQVPPWPRKLVQVKVTHWLHKIYNQEWYELVFILLILQVFLTYLQHRCLRIGFLSFLDFLYFHHAIDIHASNGRFPRQLAMNYRISDQPALHLMQWCTHQIRRICRLKNSSRRKNFYSFFCRLQ